MSTLKKKLFLQRLYICHKIVGFEQTDFYGNSHICIYSTFNNVKLWQKDPGECWGLLSSSFLFFWTALLPHFSYAIIPSAKNTTTKTKLNCVNLSTACIILYSYGFSTRYWHQHPTARVVGLVSHKYCSSRGTTERLDLGGWQDGPVHPKAAQGSGGDSTLGFKGCWYNTNTM